MSLPLVHLAALLSLAPLPGLGGETLPPGPCTYAVVVSDDTYRLDDWRAVVDAITAKYHARVIQYTAAVEAAELELSACLPDYVCFVVRPEEAHRQFVTHVHRLMRRLDDDPYTDALWGIVTGYDASDALRIAQQTDPLHITRGASGAGAGHIALLPDGFASSETSKNDFWVREGGQERHTKVEPDPARALAEGLNTLAPQVFFTSGHATERDWQIGYGFYAGQFRCDDGQLFALNTAGERFDINSPNPKVYIAAGNCLIGHIPDRQCMALAWMHTGGVHQMVGYTTVTWYGYMGWGTLDLFATGRYTLAEAFFFNNQALLHKLQATRPDALAVEPESYEQEAIEALVREHALDRDGAGLLWDRDAVAFYGDPAWEARMPPHDPGWQDNVAVSPEGTVTYTITATRDGNWPGRPIMAWLPQRMADIQVTAGAELRPVVTDNFILVPLAGACKAGDQVTITLRGCPLVRPVPERTRDTAQVATHVARLPTPYRPEASQTLAAAGPNRRGLLALIAATAPEHLEGLGFLLANMPPSDARTLSPAMLAENLRLAYEARAKAPWGSTISDELFLNEVLPYANLDEPRDPWRRLFFERFASRAWGCSTPGEAARLLNRTIFPELGVQYHATKRRRPHQSPAESIALGYASCTGLSLMLVDACRACGIPAHIAGIPEWKVSDGQQGSGGNHNWVEIWDQGWHSLGAAEDTPLDQGWFVPATRGPRVDPAMWQHCIYAASFRRTGHYFPLAWAIDNRQVPGTDVTARYRAASP